MSLILASKSQSRRAMLDAAGVQYEAIPAHIDERAIETRLDGASPAQIAVSLAEAKAMKVSEEMPGRLVLGSDSLVTVDGRRFDKPGSREEAAEHLRFFSGKTMKLDSAAVLVIDGERVFGHGENARLYVRHLSENFIERYLDAEWPEVGHCVGVFRIEALGPQLFERITGDQFTVLGMPLLAVLGALRAEGVLPE